MENNVEDTTKTNSNVLFGIVSGSFIVGGIVCVILYFKNPTIWGGHMSLIGSLISIIGLTIAIWQIIQTKKAAIDSSKMAKAAKKAVSENTTEINKYLSYASVSQCERLVDEIESFIHSKNNDRLFLRLKELKDNLIDIKANPKIPHEIIQKDLDKMLLDLESDILSVGKILNAESNNTLDYNLLLNHVEKTKTKLTSISSDLKYEKL